MIFLIAAALAYPNYTVAVPSGFTSKTEIHTSDGGTPTRKEITMKLRGATGDRYSPYIAVNSYNLERDGTYAAALAHWPGDIQGSLEQQAPTRVAPLTTADGRSVPIWVYPKGIGRGYARFGMTEVPGGFVTFRLEAPSGAGRRTGNPAFLKVVRSFRAKWRHWPSTLTTSKPKLFPRGGKSLRRRGWGHARQPCKGSPFRTKPRYTSERPSIP